MALYLIRKSYPQYFKPLDLILVQSVEFVRKNNTEIIVLCEILQKKKMIYFNKEVGAQNKCKKANIFR